MITEDYCSYEVAKLLKEKGFDETCYACYEYFSSSITMYSGWPFEYKGEVVNNSKDRIKCPTHQMAMKWLREVYHIEINITFGFPFIDGKQQYKYFWSIVRVCDNHLEYPMDDQNSAFYNEEMTDSYEEAVEAAIKYCLENLI